MKSFGGPDVLKPTELPKPHPKVGEILIRVRAAGINPIDYKIRSGNYTRAKSELPSVPGRDVSGQVEALGPDVSGLHVGDEVYAFLASHSGGYADFAIAQENEVALKPRTLDHTTAAAVPLAGVTAWQALFDYGNLNPGQRVLIHGAAGGVGHFAVQFAKARNATVFATGGPQDLDFLHNLGADKVINYKEEAFEDEVSEIDLVVDLIAGETQQRSWKVLKRGGTLVSTLSQPSEEEASQHQARAKAFMAKPTRQILTEIAQLIDAGKVHVVLQKTYPLEQAGQAQDDLEHEHSKGKRVLVLSK
ncbi:MAG TPA: NADP-dependent oxidoreductase [Opitutaceae bacterium]|nr:NADP-dependent oxidoreductase [Opitutaceae bacterium]